MAIDLLLRLYFDYDLLNPIFQLEKGVDGLFDSFARLDSRISSVGQTAAKIGDHLQVSLPYRFLLYASDPCCASDVVYV